MVVKHEAFEATVVQIDEMAATLASIRDELQQVGNLGPIRQSRLLMKLVDLQSDLEGAARLAGLMR
ncbi:MAG: hypothetical protein AB7K24_08435 [Gemmataceae bacterium]